MTTCYNLDKRLFFVHIPKCAGTSIGGIVGDDGIHRDCWLDENVPGWTRDGLPNGHQPVRLIEEWTGKPVDWWDKIICPIRNPFAQQLSQWRFWRKRGRNTLDLHSRCHPDDRLALSRTLKQFVMDDRCNGPNSMMGRAWRFAGGYYKWWVEHEKQVPPNVYIVPVEELPGSIHRVLSEYVTEITELPTYNTTEPVDWRKYYDEDMIRHMLDKFGWSFAIHYPGLAQEARELIYLKQSTSTV